MLTQESITLLLSIWGTFTGSLALLLQARKYRRDRPDLKVQGSFSVPFAPPGEPKLRLRIANTGRRPIGLDTVVIQLGAGRWWLDLLRRLQGHGIAEATRYLKCDLEEGRFKEVEYTYDIIPNDLDFRAISRMWIRDQTGKLWRVGRLAGRRELLDFLASVKMSEDRLEGENRDRDAEFEIFKVGDRYRAVTRLRERNRARSRNHEFFSHENTIAFREKFFHVSKKFIDNEGDSIGINNIEIIYEAIEKGWENVQQQPQGV